MLEVWPMHPKRIFLVGQLTRYLGMYSICILFILPSSYKLTIITETMRVKLK